MASCQALRQSAAPQPSRASVRQSIAKPGRGPVRYLFALMYSYSVEIQADGGRACWKAPQILLRSSQRAYLSGCVVGAWYGSYHP